MATLASAAAAAAAAAATAASAATAFDLASVAALDPSCVCRFRDAEAPAALASRLAPPPLHAYANGSNAFASGANTGGGTNTSSSSGGSAVAAAAELALRCSVPALGVASGGAAPVSASLNAQDFCASGASFRIYPQPRVSSVHPSAGPLAGSTTLTVHGS